MFSKSLTNLQESVNWLTDSGKLMREKYDFYSEICALSQERSQIKTIVENYEVITTFQAQLTSLDLKNQNFTKNFYELTSLEKISQVFTKRPFSSCFLSHHFYLRSLAKTSKK